MKKRIIALAMVIAAGTAIAAPLPPVAAAAPTAFFAVTSPLPFGHYREGNVPVAQIIIEPQEYLGFVHLQSFKPFYLESLTPIRDLPIQFACCILDLHRYAGGFGGAVRVMHVYLDPSPLGGPPSHSGFIGPIESWVVEGDEVINITAPFQGRRARRLK